MEGTARPIPRPEPGLGRECVRRGRRGGSVAPAPLGGADSPAVVPVSCSSEDKPLSRSPLLHFGGHGHLVLPIACHVDPAGPEVWGEECLSRCPRTTCARTRTCSKGKLELFSKKET